MGRSEPSKQRYPALYKIVRRKGDSVAKVLSTIHLNISFRGALAGGRLNEWLNFVSLVVPITLNENKDGF